MEVLRKFEIKSGYFISVDVEFTCKWDK